MPKYEKALTTQNRKKMLIVMLYLLGGQVRLAGQKKGAARYYALVLRRGKHRAGSHGDSVPAALCTCRLPKDPTPVYACRGAVGRTA